VRSAPS
jgi:GNAT superfamily N-acetyltransferase